MHKDLHTLDITQPNAECLFWTEIVNIDLMSGLILSLGDCLGYNLDSEISLDNVINGGGERGRGNMFVLTLCDC